MHHANLLPFSSVVSPSTVHFFFALLRGLLSDRARSQAVVECHQSVIRFPYMHPLFLYTHYMRVELLGFIFAFTIPS